jgi:hypothetical protein
MDRNRRNFQKQITQVLSQNLLKEIQMIILPEIYNYLGLPYSIKAQIVRKWSGPSPYDLETVKAGWEHHWKAS